MAAGRAAIDALPENRKEPAMTQRDRGKLLLLVVVVLHIFYLSCLLHPRIVLSTMNHIRCFFAA